MSPLLLQSLSNEFEALTRNCDISPVCFVAFFLKTVQYVDPVFDLRKVDRPVPCIHAIRVESELQLTIRELRSRGSGASLDVREGSMLAMTLLPGA